MLDFIQMGMMVVDQVMVVMELHYILGLLKMEVEEEEEREVNMERATRVVFGVVMKMFGEGKLVA